MGTTLNKKAFKKMIKEDLEWLEKQPRTLERMHIAAILEDSVEHYYPEKEEQTLEKKLDRLFERRPLLANLGLIIVLLLALTVSLYLLEVLWYSLPNNTRP